MGEKSGYRGPVFEYCPRQILEPHPIPVSGTRAARPAPARAENDRLLE